MSTTVFRYVNVGVVGLVILWTVLFIFREKNARWLVREDHPVQWIQVLLLLVAVFYCFLVFKGYGRYYRSTLIRSGFLLFLLLLILFVGEEISWGQRLLGIETPEALQDINIQDEITLHNIKYVQRIRHWMLITLGAVGLSMIFRGDYLRKKAGETQLGVFLPARDFKIIFAFILASGLFVEAADLFRSSTPTLKRPRGFDL